MHENIDGTIYRSGETAWALTAKKGTGEPLLLISIQDGRAMDKDQNGLGISDEGIAYTLDKTGAQSIFSPAASPARTSASPGNGADSPGSDPACSSSSPESQMSLLDPEDGALSRTCPVCSHRMGDGTWLPFSGRWPTSGFGTWPTEFWTQGTSECPKDGGVCSSLPDVLMADPPARFSLSPRAAAGILRRAEKRGRELPQALRAALTELASAHRERARA